MRKFCTFLLLLVMAASCQDDPTNDVVSGGDILFSGTAAITAIEPGAAPIPFTWETDTDRIGLFSTKGERAIFTNVYYAAQNMGESVSFVSPAAKNSVVWENAFEAQNFYAYYPYRSSLDDLTTIPVAIDAEQNGNLAKRDFVWYTASENRLPSEGAIPMDFKAACGFLRCSITTDRSVPGIRSIKLTCDDEALTFAGTLNLKEGSLTMEENIGSHEIIVAFDRAVTLGSDPVVFYVALKPGLAGRTITVTCDTGKLQYPLGELTVSDEGIVSGSWSSCHLGSTVEPREGVNLSAQGTANTYLVNKPATTYCFRADVKGNGVARTYSWSVEGEPVSKGYTDADLTIRPTDAKLLWYNTPMQASGWSKACPIDPESVVLDPIMNYVYFTTPENFVEGNVGIAVYDEAGEILWSWNIWAVESYDCDLTARQVGRYTVMDRNLGAMAGKEVMNTSDPREAARAFGHYYQWGRKDPFPAAPTYDKGGELAGGMKWGLPTHTPIKELQKNCSSQDWGDADMLYSADLASNAYGLAGKLGDNYKLDDAVAASVKYPYKWVSNGSDSNSWDNFYTWHQKAPADNVEMSEWRYLWGSVDMQTSEKSIYDPCPPGWKVPTGDMYYYLMKEVEDTEWGVYSKAYDLYIPKNGQRQGAFGGSQLSGVGTDIFLATASVGDLRYPYRANVGSGVTSWNTYGAQGTQMRCVKENVPASVAPLGKQNGHRAALMGDSITRTWKDRGRAAFFTENDYLNFGQDGTTSQNMVNRFNSQVLADDPLCAVICCGTNDIADNDQYFRPIEDIFNNIRFMAERANEYGAKVVIGTAAPTRDMWWQTDEWKALYNGDFVANRIVELNKLLKAYAEERGFGYADYYSALASEDGDLKEIYWWDGWDHVHPNYDAFIVMEGILKPLIDDLLYDPNLGSVGGNPIDDMDKWEWK